MCAVNVAAANIVARFGITTKNCRYKVERAEESPKANRVKLLASEDSDEAPD